MKKLILILSAVTMLNMTALFADGMQTPPPLTLNYPEFTGNISDPECQVVYHGDGYIIVKHKGKTYVYYY